MGDRKTRARAFRFRFMAFHCTRKRHIEQEPQYHERDFLLTPRAKLTIHAKKELLIIHLIYLIQGIHVIIYHLLPKGV